MANIELKPYKHQSSFRRIAAVAWGEPNDPTIYGTAEVRADRLMEWIDLRRRETGEKLTVTVAVARALALAIKAHPDVNALVRLGRLELRRDIDIFLQVALPKEGGVGGTDLSGTVIRQIDTKTATEINRELTESAKKLRNNEDKAFEKTKGQAHAFPAFIFGWLLKLIQFLQYTLNIDTSFLGAPRDPFGSAMVTSLGMLGVNIAYAPFFPLARVPIIVLVGAVEEKPVVEDGAVVVRKVLQLNGTFDHRVVDGYHGALLSREMKLLLENPRRLEAEGARADMLNAAADNTTDLETLELDGTSEQERANGV